MIIVISEVLPTVSVSDFLRVCRKIEKNFEIKMSKCSTRNIACACGSNQIKEYKSLREIIFGWDKFNSITSLVLIIALVLWSVIFFIAIENKVTNSDNHGGHGEHGGDGDHGNHDGHGTHEGHDNNNNHENQSNSRGHEDKEKPSNNQFLPLIQKFALATDQKLKNL